jgi:hypothetical protein
VDAKTRQPPSQPLDRARRSRLRDLDRGLWSSGKLGASASSGTPAGLTFANCMRSHGVPHFPDLRAFPDPTLSAPAGATRVLALRGMVFALGPGIDPRAPAFSRAAAACGLKLATAG